MDALKMIDIIEDELITAEKNANITADKYFNDDNMEDFIEYNHRVCELSMARSVICELRKCILCEDDTEEIRGKIKQLIGIGLFERIK